MIIMNSMKDTRSPQTKIFHRMIEGWLKEKPQDKVYANINAKKYRLKHAKRLKEGLK